MAFRKYTKCYEYPGPLHSAGKPFNKKRDSVFDLAVAATIALSIMASGIIIGAAGGPVGLVIGAIAGFVVGVIVGVAHTITQGANKWLYQRLICLAGRPKCAVGIVVEGPAYSELGDLDNDEFFDLQLMPHRKEDNYVTLYDPASPQQGAPRYGTVAADQTAHIVAHPQNEIYLDNFQGEELLKPQGRMLQPEPEYLGYNDQTKDPKELHTASGLHCEAEGDFWVRMKDLAFALGALAVPLVALTVGGAVAGGSAGFASGCALGAWFFGPIGCLIGGIIGAILGAAALGAAAGLGSKAIVDLVLQAIFDANPGEVEDANVGDASLGPIIPGNRVAVLGEFVYDGFHDGWHELHPLMAVQKIVDDRVADGDDYLTWDPFFSDGVKPPTGLSADDMRKGMNSTAFAARARDICNKWCATLREPFEPKTRQEQQKLTHRWTIHPLVDGCDPNEPPSPGPGPGDPH